MRICIQVCLNNGWDNNPAVAHEVENRKEALNFAYLLSHQHGNTTVRLTFPMEDTAITKEYIGKLSGEYIQSTIPNYTYGY